MSYFELNEELDTHDDKLPKSSNINNNLNGSNENTNDVKIVKIKSQFYKPIKKNQNKIKNGIQKISDETSHIVMPPKKRIFGIKTNAFSSNIFNENNPFINKKSNELKGTPFKDKTQFDTNVDMNEIVEIPTPPLDIQMKRSRRGSWNWGWGLPLKRRRNIIRRRRTLLNRYSRSLRSMRRMYPSSIFKYKDFYYLRSEYAPSFWPEDLYYNGYIPLIEPKWWSLYYENQSYPSIDDLYYFLPGRKLPTWRRRRYSNLFGFSWGRKRRVRRRRNAFDYIVDAMRNVKRRNVRRTNVGRLRRRVKNRRRTQRRRRNISKKMSSNKDLNNENNINKKK